MEALEQKLKKLNAKGSKLRDELTRVLTELEVVEKERPQILLEEIGNATTVFEERDKIYREQKANPPALNIEDQRVISFYESLGDDQESRIIKTKLGVHYKKAIARRQQTQGKIEPRISAGTVIVPYDTEQGKGVYVCITVSPQGRNQKGGVIETLVDAVTLGIDGLLNKDEKFSIQDQGKFVQVNLQNKDLENVYELLEELKPAEFDRANVIYTCIRADVSNGSTEAEQLQIPLGDANDPSIIYANDAAKEHHIAIQTIRDRVREGTLEARYVKHPTGGRPRLYITRESFESFLKSRVGENGATNS